MTVARARIAGASLAAVAWVAFLLLTTTVVRHPAPFAVDASVSPALVDWAVGSTFVTGLCRGLDVAGGYLIDVMIVLVVFVLLVRAARALMGVSLIASALGGVLLSDAVKAWVDRPRPPTVGVLLTETTSSYPSGHTTSGITVWVALGLVALVALRPGVRWWVAAPLMAFGVIIGVSRVVVGVHWPTDVLGGWLLGVAWLSSVIAVATTMALRRGAQLLLD